MLGRVHCVLCLVNKSLFIDLNIEPVPFPYPNRVIRTSLSTMRAWLIACSSATRAWWRMSSASWATWLAPLHPGPPHLSQKIPPHFESQLRTSMSVKRSPKSQDPNPRSQNHGSQPQAKNFLHLPLFQAGKIHYIWGCASWKMKF